MTRIIANPGDRARVLTVEVCDAEARAASILERARSRAVEIVSQAENARVRIEDDAKKRATQDAVNEMEARWGQLVASIDSANKSKWKKLEGDALRIAIAAAKHIIAEELSSEPKLIQRIVASVLEGIKTPQVLRIVVHPDDASALGDLLGTTVELDESVGRGGCVIESAAGTVDAGIRTRLDALINHIESESQRLAR